MRCWNTPSHGPRVFSSECVDAARAQVGSERASRVCSSAGGEVSTAESAFPPAASLCVQVATAADARLSLEWARVLEATDGLERLFVGLPPIQVRAAGCLRHRTRARALGGGSGAPASPCVSTRRAGAGLRDRGAPTRPVRIGRASARLVLNVVHTFSITILKEQFTMDSGSVCACVSWSGRGC